MKRIVAVLLAFLLLPSPASAQETPTPAQPESPVVEAPELSAPEAPVEALVPSEPEVPVPGQVTAEQPSADAPARPEVEMPSTEDAERLLEELLTAPGQVTAALPDPSQLTVTAPTLNPVTVPPVLQPTLSAPQPPTLTQQQVQLVVPDRPDLSAGSTLQTVPFPAFPAVDGNAASSSTLAPPISAEQLRDGIRAAMADEAAAAPELLLPQASQGLSFSPIWLLMGLLLGVIVAFAVMTLFRRRDDAEAGQTAGGS